MQLHLAMATAWRAALLVLWQLSFAYAAVEKGNLEAMNSDPEFAIIQLDPGELSDGAGLYTLQSQPGSRGVTKFGCYPGRKYTPVTEAGTTYIGCCVDGQHLSGSATTGFSCCGPNTERTGTADACCAKGQEVKVNAATGQSRCCDAGQELVGDKTTGVACCPAGKHVSGDATTNDPTKYQCCDPGTEITGTTYTGFACCPKGTRVSGDATTHDPSKYLCCEPGTERAGSADTGYFCCGEGEQVVGSDPTGYACCPLGQQISGSVKGGQYLCCGPGHERTGSPETGYFCCLENYTWDGTNCRPPKPLCANGKQLGSDGKCACPSGLVEDNTGNCVPAPPPPVAPAADSCSSGIVSGKCYQIYNTDGRIWGSSDSGTYVSKYLTEESAHFKAGKFQICVQESCDPGIAINPGDGFSLKDMHGYPPGGSKPNGFLNNIQSGGHMSKTWDWSKAGRFSLTKWPCGRYCIGGAGTPPQGLGFTCPMTDTRGMTFYAGDPQACLEVTLKEIPCNIRDVTNNCIWRTPADQCCGGNVDCPNPAAQNVEAATAQKPLGGG